MAGKDDPNAIIPLKIFDKETITVAGGPVESAPINLAYYRSIGNYGMQLAKVAGGYLKLTYKSSVNGEKHLFPDDVYPVLDESETEESKADRLLGFRPSLCVSVIIVAEAINADIHNLELWMAVQ